MALQSVKQSCLIFATTVQRGGSNSASVSCCCEGLAWESEQWEPIFPLSEGSCTVLSPSALFFAPCTAAAVSTGSEPRQDPECLLGGAGHVVLPLD